MINDLPGNPLPVKMTEFSCFNYEEAFACANSGQDIYK